MQAVTAYDGKACTNAANNVFTTPTCFILVAGTGNATVVTAAGTTLSNINLPAGKYDISIVRIDLTVAAPASAVTAWFAGKYV